MEAAGEFGLELRRLRVARGMSLGDLAMAVHYHRSYLSRLERGLRAPTPGIARLCDAAVAADGALVALTRTGRGAAVGLPAVAAASDLSRAFMRGADGAELLTDDVEGILVGARRMFLLLRAEGHISAPSVLLPALAAQFGVVRAAARRARGPVRQQLVMLAAHYVEYAGWMIQECGDDAGAIAMTETAAELARLAGEPGLAAYALVRQADVALYRGDGETVVALASRALDGAGAVRSLARQRAAQGWALIGRTRECLDSLSRAEQDDTVGARSGDLPLGSSGGGRLSDVVRGWCLLDLGQPERAAESLHAGLTVAPADAHRARALYGVRLAMSHAACGDRQQARRAGLEALDEARRVDSASVRHQLRALAAHVRRWPADRGLHHFRIEIDRALSAGRRRS